MKHHLSENCQKSALFRKPWQHLSSLKPFQLILLLHYVKENPHTYFESTYNTLQWFWFQICVLDMEFFAAISLLSLRKTYKNICILLWIKEDYYFFNDVFDYLPHSLVISKFARVLWDCSSFLYFFPQSKVFSY